MYTFITFSAPFANTLLSLLLLVNGYIMPFIANEFFVPSLPEVPSSTASLPSASDYSNSIDATHSTSLSFVSPPPSYTSHVRLAISNASTVNPPRYSNLSAPPPLYIRVPSAGPQPERLNQSSFSAMSQPQIQVTSSNQAQLAGCTFRTPHSQIFSQLRVQQPVIQYTYPTFQPQPQPQAAIAFAPFQQYSIPHTQTYVQHPAQQVATYSHYQQPVLIPGSSYPAGVLVRQDDLDSDSGDEPSPRSIRRRIRLLSCGGLRFYTRRG